jgi:endogenous inhibitor of DNA gyrase (YacG/DUF329 family)
VTCPVCRKPAVAAYRPFCSRRCADVDLGRWLTGSYRVPTDEAPDAGQTENSAPPLDSPRGTS